MTPPHAATRAAFPAKVATTGIYARRGGSHGNPGMGAEAATGRCRAGRFPVVVTARGIYARDGASHGKRRRGRVRGVRG
jgi:hypothetical protein